eukprot:UN23848
MFSAMQNFDMRTHAMITLCRVFYMLNNIPSVYILDHLGGPLYQLTKLINLLPILVAYRVLMGEQHSAMKWLNAISIVLFAFVYTNLDNLGEGDSSLDFGSGLPFVGMKIAARTCYTVLQDLILKQTISKDINEIVKIQVLNFYDAMVCLIYTVTVDYSIISADSASILVGWNLSTALLPLAEASYSFISLKVLGALSGEALSLSQGFALVIVYIFSVIMGAQANYNSVLAIIGVAVGNILYGLISKNESNLDDTMRGI